MFLRLASKNFMQKKNRQISQKDALTAERQKNNNAEVKRKCLTQFALNAENKLKFLLTRLKAEMFFAKNVLMPKKLQQLPLLRAKANI